MHNETPSFSITQAMSSAAKRVKVVRLRKISAQVDFEDDQGPEVTHQSIRNNQIDGYSLSRVDCRKAEKFNQDQGNSAGSSTSMSENKFNDASSQISKAYEQGAQSKSESEFELNMMSPSASSSLWQATSTKTLLSDDGRTISSTPNSDSPFQIFQQKNKEEIDEEKRRRRRPAAYCQLTQCCCCISAAIAIGLILLATLIAAIILLSLQPKTTTTRTTVTTVTTTTATTSSTSTTTSTITTTTVGCSSCTNFCWNQTSAAVAGTASLDINDPRSIEFDANDTMYIGGHDINYVYKSTSPYTTRTTATTSFNDHLDYLIFDKNGAMYTNDHSGNQVRWYAPGSTTGTIIAGGSGPVVGSLNNPIGLAIDPDLNLYIGDEGGKKVFLMNPARTTLTSVIDTSAVISKQSALLFPKNSYDRLYISDEGGDGVYLWRINASTFDQKLTNVVGGVDLNEPRGMKFDSQGNLYVADKKNKRIVMFCVNSTIGNVIATMNTEPQDLAFDSQMNLYAVTSGKDVLKFDLL